MTEKDPSSRSLSRIVVGVDFSDESDVALEHAIALARPHGAEVVMVHALTVYEPELNEEHGFLSRDYREVLHYNQTEAREKLAWRLQRFGGQGAVLSDALIDGYPDTALCMAATELDADLIVLGTHGRTGFKRLLLGSIAEKVIRSADRAVMVARGGRRFGRFQRILVPTDFTRSARHALDLAIRMATPGARIDILHCWVPPVAQERRGWLGVGIPSNDDLSVRVDEWARARGDELIADAGDGKVELTFHSVQSQPVPEIQRRAGGYDLVALGSHGRRGLRRLLLGSVAEQTARHAPCSVVVAHPPPAE